jgi:H+/Cl- antiporter ClcA
LKILFIPVFIGLTSGCLSSAFLYLLNEVTLLREKNPFLLYLLPLFGFLFSWVIRKIPHHINQGVPYILEELNNEKAKVSPWMAPFIFFSSLGTHLFGGSAGREGVGVIMGASAAHLLPKLNRSFENLRPYLIYGGMAAGFSSIFGTPLAAIIFSFELHSFKDLKDYKLLVCTILSSFIAFATSNYLGPSHQLFQVLFSWSEVIPYILLSGIISGFGAHFFYWGYKGYTRLISYLFPRLEIKLGLGSFFICFLVIMTNSYQYLGIGTDFISQTFVSERTYFDFLMKALLTIMTLSIGFKGGEVTPLFFMGSALSNWFCSALSFKNFGLSSSLGMTALFGAVTATPLASALMGAELYGWKAGVLCFFGCWIARFVFGKRCLYRH